MDMFNALRGKNGGKVSMMRTMTFMVVVVILVIYVIWNLYSMIKGREYVTMGMNEVYIILLALGAKVSQSVFGEKSVVDKGKEEKPKEELINGPG